MSDENAMKVIRLNQIIRNAQAKLQEGAEPREVWNALYVPPDLLLTTPPREEQS